MTKVIDVPLILSAILITLLGFSAMQSFGATSFAERQILWVFIASIVFAISSSFDYSFLRNRSVVFGVYVVTVILLSAMFIIGATFKGAQSWINLGGFAIQPSEFAKLSLILVLAKYFSRRHVEIAIVRHLVVSGIYTFIIFLLVLLQPDFGSAMIIFFIWFGMVIASGMSKKHILALVMVGVLAFTVAWQFVFKEYQKQRVISFIHPMQDIHGSGYNAYQSIIAVGSGGLFGKGIGYGTQSKLEFLPEHETDFIFAAFAEEWGFVGVIMLFVLFSIVVWRLLFIAMYGITNFEVLFILGVATMFVSNFFVNIGMNIGLLPVTGVTLPFMSYGGSHLIVEFLALGIITGMKKNARKIHPEELENEFFGV
jgi:rod shape determining protein RodA